MNTMMNSTLLNAHAANEVLKRVNGSCSCGCGGGCISTARTREKDREEMWFGFAVGVTLGIAYLLTPSHKDGFVDFFYIIFSLICGLSVNSVSLDEKQPKSAIKTSLVLSAILALVMFVPFILDMDTQIHFKEFLGGVSHNDGPWEYFYREYTDYTNIFQIGIMVIFCLIDVIIPIRELYKMK